MTGRWGAFSVYAPEPVGVGYTGLGCPCDPTRGQSCSRCDGTEWWKSARIPETAPPCMKEEET